MSFIQGDVKDLVLHHAREFRKLWYKNNMKGLRSWIKEFNDTILFPVVDAASTTPLEDKLRAKLNNEWRISISEEIESMIEDYHGDAEESADDPTFDVIDFINSIAGKYWNASSDVKLDTAEDCFNYLTTIVDIEDWCEKNNYDVVTYADVRDQIMPYMENFFYYSSSIYYDGSCFVHTGKPFPEVATRVIESKRDVPKTYRRDEWDPNEGQFYTLLEFAIRYYNACSIFIKNEIAAKDFRTMMGSIYSDLDYVISAYREEYWEKHFEDCITPMGTYEEMQHTCASIIAILEFIE